MSSVILALTPAAAGGRVYSQLSEQLCLGWAAGKAEPLTVTKQEESHE